MLMSAVLVSQIIVYAGVISPIPEKCENDRLRIRSSTDPHTPFINSFIRSLNRRWQTCLKVTFIPVISARPAGH